MALPSEVIATDHQLEDVAQKAGGQLAKHRWHWTLNEANPSRVPMLTYAREVGRSEATIRKYATGYAEARSKVVGPDEPDSNLVREQVDRASMGAETHAAAEAVGRTRGLSVQGARTHRREEVRRVRDTARERAAERGTSVEEEASKFAEQIVKQEHADAKLAEQRKANLGLRYIEVEGILAAMYRKGTDALEKMKDQPWEEEHRELLVASLNNIKAVLGLIDLALTGAADVDWDKEMEKLT